MEAHNTSPNRRNLSRCVLLAVGLFLTIILLAGLRYGTNQKVSGPILSAEREYTYIDDDYPLELPGPEMRRLSMLIVDEAEDSFEVTVDENATLQWSSLAPEGGAFVALGSNRTFYSVTMWHQLHCVNNIRIALVTGEWIPSHMHHCLNYLRQTILCNGDLTLEPWRPEVSPTVNMRVCKDPSQMYHQTEALQDWI